jgi:hypothetical protein
VQYQRNADFGQQKLLNLDNKTEVDVSIDPFFFSVTPAAARRRKTIHGRSV